MAAEFRKWNRPTKRPSQHGNRSPAKFTKWRKHELGPTHSLQTGLFYFDPHDPDAIHSPQIILPLQTSKRECTRADATVAKLHNSKPPLCSLPQELLLILAKLLPIEGLYNLAQICKDIREALHEHLYQKQGQCLLLWAASNGKRALAQKAITSGENIDVNFIESDRTALAQVIENYTPDTTKFLLRLERINFAGTAKLLLDQQDIDLSDETNGISMLERAITKGVYPVVERLLQYRQEHIGADHIGALFQNGQTPLTTAAWYGHKDILELLVSSGADVNQCNNSGRTALAQAIEDCDTDTARLLLEQQDIDLTDETNGIHVLERAITKGVVPVVERLLQCRNYRQAHINAPFKNGQTPLITAARCGREDVLDLLLTSGADVNRQSGWITGLDDSVCSIGYNSGDCWAALTMAARQGHGKIVQRLLNYENIKTHVLSRDFSDHEMEGDAVFWAAVKKHHPCLLALFRSPQVSYTAEQINWLLAKVKSVESRRRGDYSVIYSLLRACQGTNSPESRQANLQHLTATKLTKRMRAIRVQHLLQHMDEDELSD